MTDYRTVARDLLVYACGGSRPIPSPAEGRRVTDRVYRAVTEGRHDRAIRAKQFYSSCGDLAQWLLYRVGCRESWINRDELDGWHFSGQPGHPAWDNNVTTLVTTQRFGVNRYARIPGPHDLFGPGDILVVNTSTPATTHVACVLEDRRDHDGSLITADYGQPGGAVRRRAVSVFGSKLRLGTRWIDSWLPLNAALDGSAAVGRLAQAETAEAWRVRLGLPELPPDTLPSPPRHSSSPPPPAWVSLKRNDHGERVGEWQRRLAAAGYQLARSFRSGRADEDFGPETEQATEACQRDHLLPQTGIVDRATWDACKPRHT